MTVRYEGNLLPGREVLQAKLRVIKHRGSLVTIKLLPKDIQQPTLLVLLNAGFDCRHDYVQVIVVVYLPEPSNPTTLSGNPSSILTGMIDLLLRAHG